MSGLFQCLKATIVPFLVKAPRNGPWRIEHLSDENTPENGPYRGTTKAPQDTGECILTLLDKMIQGETLLTRQMPKTGRENIRLVRNFIEKHGWPEKGYVIWALKGVVLVLTEGQWAALPESPARADVFALGGPDPMAINLYGPTTPSLGDFIEINRFENGLFRYHRYPSF